MHSYQATFQSAIYETGLSDKVKWIEWICAQKRTKERNTNGNKCWNYARWWTSRIWSEILFCEQVDEKWEDVTWIYYIENISIINKTIVELSGATNLLIVVVNKWAMEIIRAYF